MQDFQWYNRRETSPEPKMQPYTGFFLKKKMELAQELLEPGNDRWGPTYKGVKKGVGNLTEPLVLLVASPRGVEPRLQAWKAKRKRTPPDIITFFVRLNPFKGVKSRLESRLIFSHVLS